MKRLAFLIPLLFLFPQLSHAALTTNLVAYWKLDEASGNAADSSGAGLTLTNTNTATFSAGKINNGANLNGSNQRFSSTAAGLQLTGDLTFTCWVKPDAVTGSRFLLWNTFAGGSGFISGLEVSAGSLFMRAAVYNGSNHDFTYTSTAIPSSSYTHVAFVFTSAAGQVDFYKDGTNIHTETGYPTIPSKATAFLGIDGNLGAGNFYKGQLDECGLWSRALTSTEISSLYNAGAGLQYPFSIASVVTPILGLVRSFWIN